MPWNVADLMTQRHEFIELLLLPNANITALCNAHNISRKTAYKWLNRYKAGELASLKDKSRARKSQPDKTPAKIENLIIQTHKEYPHWGPRKLRNLLINQNKLKQAPSVSTVSRILVRNNCEVIKNNKSKPATTRFERSSPNDLWQMDFKGSFMLDHHRCYPLTILDDYSRYSIGLKACENEKEQTVKTHLISCFKKFGLPNQINVDNGNPWGCSDLESRSSILVWLIKLGVHLSFSSPFHPQTNGKDERFHRTLKLEVLHNRKYKNTKHIQKAFDEWQQVYNHLRPHDALNGKPPSSRYHVSNREYSDRPIQYEYDKNDIVRKVHPSNGYFKFKGTMYRVGSALGGEYVAIKETAQENEFCVFFMDMFLKKFII